jgi:H/ACA ribonucleoprotein complex subunit 4
MLVKAEDVTNPNFGCPPGRRSVDSLIKCGLINIDKPPGPTSHEVVAWVKKILVIDKAGHGGTLDPGVSGVLPVFLGSATKAARVFISKKEYVCLMKLHSKSDRKTIESTCKEFVGKIYQRPPLESAVKRRIRIRDIYYLHIIETEGENVLMKIGCEAGLYIRKLVHDLGEALGCEAHMDQLRRTRSEPFKEEDACTMHDLKDAYVFWKEDGDETPIRRIVLPLEAGLSNLSKIYIRDSAADAICHGADLMVPGILALDDGIRIGDSIAVFTLKEEVVCISEARMSAQQMLDSESGVAADTEIVLMEPGTYPKGWKSRKSRS